MFTNNPIKSRVMKVINDRIAQAEKEYATKCVEIDVEAENTKASYADKLVKEIVGKII